MKKNSRSLSAHCPKGFTLIELMIVISVMAILGTLGIAGFKNYNEVQLLQTSAGEVVSMLNLAKSRAQSQVKIGTSCSADSQTLGGYQVDISITDKSYSLSSRCLGILSKINTGTLPKGLFFKSPDTSPTTFFFPVQIGGVEIPGQIVVSDSKNIRVIVVNSLGRANLQSTVPTSTPTPTPTLTPPPSPTSTPTPTPTSTPTPPPSPTSTPTPTPTPTPGPKLVFVTSNVYDGNLGGLAGADNKCQFAGDNSNQGAVRGRVWKAWLSDNAASPDTRFNKQVTRYTLIDSLRTPIAYSWTELTSGALRAPIYITELTTLADAAFVWTNTNAAGKASYVTSAQSCGYWSGTGTWASVTGITNQMNYYWTQSGTNLGCSNKLRLYCFEQ